MSNARPRHNNASGPSMMIARDIVIVGGSAALPAGHGARPPRPRAEPRKAKP
jgi:hypothetical protein